MIVPEELLNIFMEVHLDVVTEMYQADPSLELIPILFVTTMDGEVCSVSFPGSAWNERKYEMLAEAASELPGQVLVAVLVSEAWMSQYKVDEIPAVVPRPSQDPDRREVVMVMGMTVDGQTGCIQATIDRSDGGLKDVYRSPRDGPSRSDLLEHFMLAYALSHSTWRSGCTSST